MIKEPYKNKNVEEWEKITKNLLKKHPLRGEELSKIVLESWDDIFKCKIGTYKIGKDICPKPQILGFFLHELIALKLQSLYPSVWRIEEKADDKDVVCLKDTSFSIEIKTSSSDKNIYGNRSYSQDTKTNKKSKSGYYLAINFQKFTKNNKHPQIISIRFGWIDHEDWIGQQAQSGQQARLSADVEKNKLLFIYKSK